MEDRVLKSYFVHTEIAEGGAERRVVDRNADYKAEREKAIHDPLPELGALREIPRRGAAAVGYASSHRT